MQQTRNFDIFNKVERLLWNRSEVSPDKSAKVGSCAHYFVN